ncbi:jacalin-related lectin 3-like [Cornus florida]|uniref:jacalin-related lectin 3-like n=1 Tax=Cornus florida TaxID=4283 RepID=UPI00289D8B61|nr:jacalin-related lectin 3-like [Cornus florida]
MANEGTVTFGPYGNSEPNNHWDDGSYNTIREINIYVASAGSEIESIQIVYDNIEGKAVSGTKHGGGGGTHYPVKLDYPTEYLVSISGYLGGYYNNNFLVVRSLTLHTNTRQHGPYGREEGTRFITPLIGGKIFGGKIVGFFGRAGVRLDSIGVYIKPFPTIIPSVGPFGATLRDGGQQWDDEIYSTVREITIYSGWVIDSIQVVYDLEGRLVSGKKHGGDGGQANPVVKLDYPDEFLVSIWGYCGQVANMVCIRSLGFQSNKRMFGPFGVEEGEKFEIPSTGGKIIGFHGSSHDYLTSIGVYLDK